MKCRLLSVGLSLVNVFCVSAATVPLYVNSTDIHSPPSPAPQIDATTFINEAVFDVNDNSVTPLPYQTTRTVNFRNEASGSMFGHPGYVFEYVSGNTRLPMTTWVNRGSISSIGTNTFFVSGSGANWLLVSSDSITNSGSLFASSQGLIRLTGNTLNLSRGKMRAGDPVTGFSAGYGGAYLFDTNYFNEPGVTDLYWGAGSNNVVNGSGLPMQLDSGFFPNFSTANLQSAFHEVVQPAGFGFFFTNTTWLPFGAFKGVNTSTYLSTNGNTINVQIVFAATNIFADGFTNDIKFFPNFSGGPAIVQVGYHTVDRDATLDTDIVRSAYVIDGLGMRTNVTLARNEQGNTRRPDTFAVSKAPYSSFFGVGGNASYTNPIPIFKSTYGTNLVDLIYAAYSGQLAAQNFAGSDPTNFPGRVEIIGQNVNMRDSRVRAESTFILTANNLTSNNLARASAPFMSFDVGTTQPQLVISNLAPPTVTRLSGNLYAWSAKWENTDSALPGVTLRFHVLIVDHDLQSLQPVTISKFLGRGPRIVLHDPLSVSQRLRLDTTSLHVKSNASLFFPTNWSWGSSNMQNIVSLTNEGFINVPGVAALGTDRGFPYTTILNRGTMLAQAHSLWADTMENSGLLSAQGGSFRFDGRTLSLRGEALRLETNVTETLFFNGEWQTNYVTNIVFAGAANIRARADLTLRALNMSLSNAVLQGGSSVQGALIISATNRLVDSGPSGTNYWISSGGIRVLQRPNQLSDLLHTYASVTAEEETEVNSIWSANDLGPISLGYSNNLALGKLTLDGGEASILRFSATAGKKAAIYVDYLELLNNATNFIDGINGLVVDPSIRIFFAHSNIKPSKFNGVQGGRIQWVSGFRGPLSTTNIVYPSGTVYPVNISLAQHEDFDSDGDGTPNFKDSTPVFSEESIGLQITSVTQPNRVLLSWQALANSTSHIEYKTTVSETASWQLLRSTNTPTTMRLNMTDTPLTGRTQRIYRVRMDLPPQ